jgi:hypothetical protein
LIILRVMLWDFKISIGIEIYLESEIET